MKLGVYAIYDKLTGYMTPGFMANDKVAVRDFGTAVTSQDMNQIKANPFDFNLNKIGEYDTDTGVLSPLPVTVIADAGQFLRKE